MKALKKTFRRVFGADPKKATIYHKGLTHPSNIPAPEGRDPSEYCATCKGLFGTITVEVWMPPHENDHYKRSRSIIVECSEEELRAFQTVGRISGHAFDVLRRTPAMIDTRTNEHYCGRCA